MSDHIKFAAIDLRLRARHLTDLAIQLEILDGQLAANETSGAQITLPEQSTSSNATRTGKSRSTKIKLSASKPEAAPVRVPIKRMSGRRALSGGSLGEAVRAVLAGTTDEFGTEWIAKRLPAALRNHDECNTRIAQTLFNMRTQTHEITLTRREKNKAYYRLTKPNQVAVAYAVFKAQNPTGKVVDASDVVPS